MKAYVMQSASPSVAVATAECDAEADGSRYPELQIRHAMAELCAALWSALDNERHVAEDNLRRATEILKGMGNKVGLSEDSRGALAPWQVRKVAAYVDTHLDQPISNEELAALVRLHPSHFGRAFRKSVGETPHDYVIRRRIEHAQGLMLSTAAPLSEIALDCGLADQSHLSRLFRRIEGETPSAWRRARVGDPSER